MRQRTRAAVFAAVSALTLVPLAPAHDTGRTPVPTITVELHERGSSAVRGLAVVSRRGARITGRVVAWGLEPRGRYAAHFHGPAGSCADTPAAAVTTQTLVADRSGVAYARVRITSRSVLLTNGFYYDLHARGAARTALCGDLRGE